MRISETYGAQALKGNSPTSGLLTFLVAPNPKFIITNSHS